MIQTSYYYYYQNILRTDSVRVFSDLFCQIESIIGRLLTRFSKSSPNNFSYLDSMWCHQYFISVKLIIQSLKEMSRFIRLLDPFCIGIHLYLFTQATIWSNNINDLLDTFSKRNKLISIPSVSVKYVDPTRLFKVSSKITSLSKSWYSSISDRTWSCLLLLECVRLSCFDR